MRKIWHGTKKVLIALLGCTVLMLGVMLIPLPGPGLLVVILGLAILASEFSWAQTWLDKAKDKFDKVTADARAKFKKSVEDLKNKDLEEK